MLSHSVPLYHITCNYYFHIITLTKLRPPNGLYNIILSLLHVMEQSLNSFLIYAQILLHPHEERPIIKEQGFAAAPGAHTLVAIERSEVRSINTLVVP